MKRKLIRQMLNQWRSNIWMVVQLLIVSCVIFAIGNALYFSLDRYFKPLGYDTAGTCQIVLAKVPEGGEGFDSAYSSSTRADALAIAERLRSLDAVESLCFSRDAAPYHANYFGQTMVGVVDSDTIQGYGNNKAIMPEYLKVFGVKSIDGTSAEAMMEMLERGEMLVSREYIADPSLRQRLGASQLRGMEFWTPGNDSVLVRVGAVVESTKRYDFDAVTPVCYTLYDITRGSSLPELSVRLKPGADMEAFVAQVREMAPTLYAVGNVYVQNVVPYQVVKDNVNAGTNQSIFFSLVFITFFLVNVFLGVLGAFWFRTRQRTPEIALRKSYGASSWSIFTRLVSEGLLLLAIAAPVAVFIDYLMVKYQLVTDYVLVSGGVAGAPWRFAAQVGLTFAIMAVMIIGGICAPALRAMKVQPAQALRDE